MKQVFMRVEDDADGQSTPLVARAILVDMKETDNQGIALLRDRQPSLIDPHK